MFQSHRSGWLVVVAFALDGGKQDLLLGTYVPFKRGDEITRQAMEPSKFLCLQSRGGLLPQVANPGVFGIHEASDGVGTSLNPVFLGRHRDSSPSLRIASAENMRKPRDTAI